METGMVVPFAGAVVPTGYLLCDGSSLLCSSYPDLFSVIGNVFGALDEDHFNVPDLRGRAVYGVGAGLGGGVSGVGAPEGDEPPNTGVSVPPVGTALPPYSLGSWFGAAQKYQMPDELVEHQHIIHDPGHGHGLSVAPHGHVVTNPSHNHGQTPHSHAVLGRVSSTPGTSNRAVMSSTVGTVDDGVASSVTATNQAATQATSVQDANVSMMIHPTTPSEYYTGWAGDNVPMDIRSPGVALNYLIKA